MAPVPDDRLRSDVWRALYDLFLEEHGRRLDSAAERGLTPGDLKALVSLTPDRGESMRALSEMWRCDASTVTWIVDRLETRGLVERRAHESDRRVKVVALSDEGRLLRARLLDDLYRPPDALSSLSRADLEALRRLLGRLR